MLAQNPLAGRSYAFQRPLGAQVAGVGLELHPQATQALQGMGQQQQFYLGVDAGALPLLAQPGPADLQRAVRRPDSQVAGAAHHLVLALLDNDKG